MTASRLTTAWLLAMLVPLGQGREPFSASEQAIALDRAIDWSRAKLIVVQEGGRYKTLDSFARENVAAMYGEEHFPGLSPLATVCDWLFNRGAYLDIPVIRIKNRGLRIHLTEHLSEEVRQRIRSRAYMTPRELVDPTVRQRLRELEPRFEMLKAVGRVRDAEETAFFLEELLRIVPRPQAPADALWYTPLELRANAALALPEADRPSEQELARQYGRPAEGVLPDEAVRVVGPWLDLEEAWQRSDASGVQAAVDRLATVLPTLAAEGVYPVESQRRAEARYYAMGKVAFGWVLYFLGALIAVWALLTGWRGPWGAAVMVLVVALGLHAYGLGLRWYILGRIPVANMFEAVVAAAWIGIVLALLVEVFYRTRVLLLAANVTGFFALVVAGYILPGGGNITAIMGILDNIMLRIHTVLIIASYGLIFLAAVIAVVYLLGYYLHRLRAAGAGREEVRLRRPILAGALPGDAGGGSKLPAWLQYTDWSHLIILNMAFVMLFLGGIVLGAAWADYSWGRPWGWDPKETFALNTWIVYAILIHARFVVKRKGLCTAWLSVAGCAMMLFNWFVVNYYIVGLHSYA